jgi:glycerophosphoryl diester phosphodiesterase
MEYMSFVPGFGAGIREAEREASPWMAGRSPATNVLKGALRIKELDLPLVIGHRGAAARAPENTLAGFRMAKSLGCTWVEFDVRLTADGNLVVCHDDRLDRTTGASGRISKLPLVAIRQLFDGGSSFSPSFIGERIPSLDEALLCCHELGLGANVEIKAEGGRGPATAAAVASCLGRLASHLPPILISSFLPDAIAEATTLLPSVPRGMLWRKIPRNWRKIAEQLGCATIHCGHADLTEKAAAAVCAAGYPLLAYTVNDVGRARQLFEWGVASVFSDAPDIISKPVVDNLAAARRGACL